MNQEFVNPGRPDRTVSLAELGAINSVYLGTSKTPDDPTLVWGSSLQTECLEDFVRAESLRTNTIITATHLLIRAVALAMDSHPNFNRRIIGKRVVALRDINILIPIFQARQQEVDVAMVRNVGGMSVVDIARHLVWELHQRATRPTTSQRSESRFPLDHGRLIQKIRLLSMRYLSGLAFWCGNRFDIPSLGFNDAFSNASALVNVFNYSGCPPMTFYKPSCLPMNSCHVHVTLGPTHSQPVVEQGEVVIRRVAPIFVRGDHRIVDTPQIARFLATIRTLLQNPSCLSQASSDTSRTEATRNVA